MAEDTSFEEGRQGWAQSWVLPSGSPDTPFCGGLRSLCSQLPPLPLDMDIRSNRKSFLSRGITGLHGGRCRNAGCVCLGFVFFPRKTKQNKYGRMHTTHKGRKSNINLDTLALAQGILSQ